MKRYDELILMIKAQGTSVRQDDYLDELGGIIEQFQREHDEVIKSIIGYVKSCDSCKYNQCSIFDEPCCGTQGFIKGKKEAALRCWNNKQFIFFNMEYGNNK